MENNFAIVVGGGHAGVEAAFALSRQKIKTSIVTMDPLATGRLSCNPAIGGLAKSHLVKEIDALGGVMGHAADVSSIQFKTLNKTKGRAVWSLRAQVDKHSYPKYINGLIKKDKNISVVSGQVASLIIKKGSVAGVVLNDGKKIFCSSVVVTCGTFMNGLIHIGLNNFPAGRMGEKRSSGLTEALVSLGFEHGRLKTGTPPRISKKTINLKQASLALGDKNPSFFSLFSNIEKPKNEACYLVNTNRDVHRIIEENIKNSPLFSGKIKGVGPRYCPSIEDKIYRFKDRDSHHLFLEPEWSGSDQIYVNGFSTSLPEKTQIKALRSIKGLENVSFVRPGYAIEYDYIPPRQLKSSLESKILPGLFFAGQMNGTSGYEEAGAQGLIAGINAAKHIKKEPPFLLSRTNSYIGVMIDDLVTSHLDEPYRMFTSRAEHRLYLRPDNAYSRLFSTAIENNILTSSQIKKFNVYFKTLSKIFSFSQKSGTYLNNKNKIYAFLKRPEVSFDFFDTSSVKNLKFFSRCSFEVETSIKYEGYIENEKERINKNISLEKLKIPKNTNFCSLPGLSKESAERLTLVKPETLGQASRIFGIRPTDITILGAYIKSAGVSRET